MSDDDRCLWWREANIPFNINGISSSFKPVYKIQSEQAYRTAQICRRLLILQGWSPSSPRNYLLTQYRCLMTHWIITDVPWQDQLIVELGLQYAVLAKCVKGLNEEIWEGVRGVMLDGAALTLEANKEMKIKPPASIVFLCFEDGYQELAM